MKNSKRRVYFLSQEAEKLKIDSETLIFNYNKHISDSMEDLLHSQFSFKSKKKKSKLNT